MAAENHRCSQKFVESPRLVPINLSANQRFQPLLDQKVVKFMLLNALKHVIRPSTAMKLPFLLKNTKEYRILVKKPEVPFPW